ncbi:PadR family transcriptional regulator [Portibacter lacus]|uniref:Transcription regulator PadR N-terminal domain-containing protein n=1 Tax=Portibacter lacus TaxID=1099794 RepID=A0AA37WD82_9BACT|nr:hypothetical protein GCM10007940_02420 [Portibacter lacus]
MCLARPLLHKLEANDTIESSIKMVKNRGRKYYRLTEKGHQETSALLEDFARYMMTMNNFFKVKISQVTG